MTEASVRTRFAPSPTGDLHPGNLRTALLNVLLARRAGGRFILRIEDTDAERRSEDALESLQRDLRWLGLDWDEGPDRGGGYGPYTQRERANRHAADLALLREQDRVYPCFCSPEELRRTRRAQRAAGRPPRYPGTCAHLDSTEAQRRQEAGERPVWRFRVPKGREVVFTDRVHGAQRAASDEIGDFVVARADGSAAYLFANAVDDARMGITHVLRGDDHLANTPRQLLILEGLELTPPEYGHVGLLTGYDGAPLGKRNGSRAVAELAAEGYLPEALLNYLARLGHAGLPDEVLDLEGLAAHFSLDRLSPSPARFDLEQLERWQADAVGAADNERLRAWMRADALIPPGHHTAFVDTVRANVARPEEAREWARIIYGPAPPLDARAGEAVRTAGPSFFESALARAAEGHARLPEIAEAVRAATGAKGRSLFMPLRAALTGRCDGPELRDLAALMGREAVAERLEKAREAAGSETRSEHADDPQ